MMSKLMCDEKKKIFQISYHLTRIKTCLLANLYDQIIFYKFRLKTKILFQLKSGMASKLVLPLYKNGIHSGVIKGSFSLPNEQVNRH